MPRPFAVVEVVRGPGIPVQTEREVRVGIIGIYVQHLIQQPVVVQVPEEAVGGDEIAGFDVRTQDVRLHFREAQAAFRDEPGIVQQQMRVMAAVQHRARAMDLAPVCVGFAPENGSPRLVERVDRTVLLLRILTECRVIGIGIELVRLAVELVVELPAHDRGMPAVMLGQPGDDPGRKPAVYGRIIVVVPARAVDRKSVV